MAPRRTIDEVLADAAVPSAARDDASRIAASRRRIEAGLADSVWQEALHRDAYARHVLTHAPSCEAMPPQASPPPVALREQAGHDLAEFSRMAITASHAAADIAGLVNSDKIEPDGALIFACLLHLADRTEGAQFWWQFSAGAGRSTAALCLYLLHLHRGEIRDAEHWAHQVAELEHLDAASSIAATARDDTFSRTLNAWECRALLLRTVSSMWTNGNHDDLSDAPRPRLAAAIKHVGVNATHDPDFGAVPQPDPSLAAQLEDAIAT